MQTLCGYVLGDKLRSEKNISILQNDILQKMVMYKNYYIKKFDNFKFGLLHDPSRLWIYGYKIDGLSEKTVLSIEQKKYKKETDMIKIFQSYINKKIDNRTLECLQRYINEFREIIDIFENKSIYISYGIGGGISINYGNISISSIHSTSIYINSQYYEQFLIYDGKIL